MKISAILLAVMVFMIAAPVQAQGVEENGAVIAGAPEAEAEIIGAEGHVIGRATFRQGPIGVLANIEVEGLPPGRHGMHLHALGTCEHEHHFTTAKGHINPDAREHGFLNPNGPEKGDLPNLIVHADGKASVELFLPQVDVLGDESALLDADGTSLMIHANPDDHITQPIGGSGDRVACGIIQANQ